MCVFRGNSSHQAKPYDKYSLLLIAMQMHAENMIELAVALYMEIKTKKSKPECNSGRHRTTQLRRLMSFKLCFAFLKYKLHGCLLRSYHLLHSPIIINNLLIAAI